MRLAGTADARSSEGSAPADNLFEARRICGDPPATSVYTAGCGMFGSGLGDRRREALQPDLGTVAGAPGVVSAWATMPVLRPWLEPSPPVGWGLMRSAR